MLQIQKRNGTLVPFDGQKIINAVNKALIEVDGQLYEDDTAKDIAKEIEDAMYDLDEKKATAVSVEDIQDMVEDELMQSERRDVARAYIRYRYKQEVQREHEAIFIAPIREKLEARNVQNQNANVDEHSFGGRLGEAAEVMTKEYAFDYIISKKSRENHMNNEIYIHDAGSYAVGSHNCLSLPVDPLMEKGFNTRQTDVRPANSISTFFQLLAVLFQLQSLQQFGGVSATHLDWSAVPYVRKSFKKHLIEGFKYIARGDKYIKDLLASGKEISIVDSYIKENYPKTYEYAYDMTEKETKQAVEGMYHNLNTLQSRSGNQLPFTSINYGTCTLPEGRMVIKALLEGSLAGVGKIHKTSIFPCGIFQCMKGVNRKPGEPNYDLYRLALKSTAARLYPNYANCDWSGNAGYDPDDPTTYFSTMGCRTANGWDINGFGQKKDGRGNICPVTIILPTLAMEAKEKIDKEYELDIKCNPFSVTDEYYINAFMDLLDTKIHEAKDMLIERFEWICSQPADSAKFMYENGTMAGYIPEEGIRSALKHGTLAVGQLGLAEALQILIGTDHTTPEGMKLAKKIEQLFKDRCAEFKEEYKLNFGVYYTPKLFGLGVAQVTA